jgi:hypothetical protein
VFVPAAGSRGPRSHEQQLGDSVGALGQPGLHGSGRRSVPEQQGRAELEHGSRRSVLHPKVKVADLRACLL